LEATNKGLFNTSSRAFPDVAAVGENVEIVVQQEDNLVAGTSCSSPIFAQHNLPLNDRLITAGKSPLGFLQPLLYANPTAFNDITTGKYSHLHPRSMVLTYLARLVGAIPDATQTASRLPLDGPCKPCVSWDELVYMFS